jgi:Rrf2 family iron-sulfur cluster assembly transcriptional regulator
VFCLSSRGRFATRILVLLASVPQGECLSKQEIAAREGLTPAYVQQLMGTLQTAGLVIGIRGKQGGFKMARAPESITVAETLRVMEGCIRLAPCQDGTNCDRISRCPTRHVWVGAAELLDDYFQKTTIADLAEGARRMTAQTDIEMGAAGMQPSGPREKGVSV